MNNRLDVLKAVMTPAGQAAPVGGTSLFFDRPWDHSWNQGTPQPWSLTADDRKAIGEFLPKLYQGGATWSDVRGAAPLIAKAFSPPDALLGAEPGSVEVEISALQDERVLSDMPWEIAATTFPLPTAGMPLFEHLAGRQALVRVLSEGVAIDTLDTFRPSVLWCVSSPDQLGEIDLKAFNNILQQTFDLYPYLQAESLPAIFGGSSKPSWLATKEQIKKRKPTIFVLVAHGNSGDGRSEPAVYFQSAPDRHEVDQIPISEVADTLRNAGCWLAVLICCDLVRETGYSAALHLIRRGVPEVVAMQGKINQATARTFLAGFLAALLVPQSTAIATARGRAVAGEHAHACLPVAFSSAAQRARGDLLAEIVPKYDIARASLAARAGSNVYMRRAACEEQLLTMLNKPGLLAIRSTLGDGATQLVKACARLAARPERRGTSRPIIYIDVHENENPELPPSRFVTQKLASILGQQRVLLPRQVEPTDSTNATSFLQFVNQARITVIFDHLPRSVAEAPEFDFWRTLLAEASGQCRNGGVCLLPDRFALERLASESALTTFTVPLFDCSETAEYVRAYLPGANGELPDQLFTDTGGRPAFLDVARLRWKMKPDPSAIAGMAARQGRDEADDWLIALRPTLSPESLQAMYEMACLGAAASEDAVIEHIVGQEAEGALDQLIERGLVARLEKVVWMPSWFREALRLGDEEEIMNARARIAERFKKLDAGAPRGSAVNALAARGDAAILECLEQSLLDSLLDGNDLLIAADVVFYSDISGTSDLAVLARYEMLMKFTKERTKKHRALPEAIAGAIARAQNLGKNDRVRELFQEAEHDEPDPYERVQLLSRKAIWLKDTKQSGALEEIDAIVKEALALTAAPHPSDGPPDADWTALRQNVFLNSLQTRLFLAGETYATLPDEYRALETNFPDSASKAVLFCTFAESEMRQPPDQVNWIQVANWLTDAGRMLENSDDHRAITYHAYQYGRYLRKHHADLKDQAYKFFKDADEAGRQSGEVRRWGLARARRVEMLLDDPSLESESQDATARARELLNEVLSKMPVEPGDALTARAIGRLQVLRARVAANEEEERQHRDRAATAFSLPMLRAQSDQKLFVTEAIRLLGKALDDPRNGNFRYAQQFVSRFRRRLGDLGVIADVDAPEAALDALRNLPLRE